MVRSLAFLVALAATSARADLQLTPEPSEYELEGVKLKQLLFHDGQKPVTYQSPRDWDYSGSANQLALHPPGKAQAQATVSKVALAQPGTFDEASLKKFMAGIAELLPKGSSAAAVVSQEKDPVKISGKETFQVVLSYNVLGQPFKRSVLFLNRDHDQLRFELVAREEDFKDLQQAFQSSLCTWRGL